MKAYYAHCMASYNTKVEKRDVNLIRSLGYEIVNPSSKDIEQKLKKHRKKSDNDMDFFRTLVESCDILFFRALPNGKITSGVAIEIVHARMCNKPILEIPSGMLHRTLSRDETVEYLKDVGNR